MNVLVTGGTGNFGSRLVVPLVRRGDTVVVFDLRSKPHFESAEFHEVKLVVGDLGNRDAVLRALQTYRIDSIFHLGAVLSSEAEQNPYDAWRANMDGIVNILDAARLNGVQRVIFSSTVATYGGQLPEPLVDDAPQWPLSLYGVTKVAGERLGVYYHRHFGLDFRGVRLPVVIAARGSNGGASAYCSMVFQESVLSNSYDFYVKPSTRAPVIYIADAVRGFLDLHDAPPEKLRRRMYNIAGISVSAEELAEVVRMRLPKVRLTYHPDPLKTAIVESWPHRIDDSEARADWGWRAAWNLGSMADEIIEVLRHEFAN